MSILSKENLKNIRKSGIAVAGEEVFDLPEKVLQFGTGVLLRGLPDYIIDRANNNGVFNGRIVVVKSTAAGSVDDFDAQDNLYTLHIKGIDNGKGIEEEVICSSISRVISAVDNWPAVLKTAQNPALQVVLSNTTEAGIALVKESIIDRVPESFPGKLLAVLYERFKVLGGNEESGLVIVPTELIVNNAKKLKEIILELAGINRLEGAFIEWLNKCNYFCDSLVDRIVPGKPPLATESELEQRYGYDDNLRISAEVYYLWAIEGNEKIRQILSFSRCSPGVIIAEDIEIYRELKLRLLNGTHTLTCAIAILCGFTTVSQAMDDQVFSDFITRLMLDEIAPAIPYETDQFKTEEFARQVLDRFRNPSIKHLWVSISVQYSLKLKMRVIPMLLNHYKKFNSVPAHFAFGFAAYIKLMKTTSQNGCYYTQLNEQQIEVKDDAAVIFHKAWQNTELKTVVHTILINKDLWDADLTSLPGFEDAVLNKLEQLVNHGASIVMKAVYNKEPES